MAVTYSNLAASWQTPYYEYRGLSTDAKPTDAPENSRFVELDTGTKFYFSNNSWHVETTAGGGSSEGAVPSGGGEPFVVTMTVDLQAFQAVGNKTYAEIYNAYRTGKRVIILADFETEQDGNTLRFEMTSDLINVQYETEGSSEYYAFVYYYNELKTPVIRAEDLDNYFTVALH